jgi:hypothetical protein
MEEALCGIQARRAAISARQHKDAGRHRSEFERLDASRSALKEELQQVLQAHARAGARKQEAVTSLHRLSMKIQAHETGMQQLQRQIDGGSFAVGPRPPKHAGKAAALQARERRFSCAAAVTGSLRGARATGKLTDRRAYSQSVYLFY